MKPSRHTCLAPLVVSMNSISEDRIFLTRYDRQTNLVKGSEKKDGSHWNLGSTVFYSYVLTSVSQVQTCDFLEVQLYFAFVISKLRVVLTITPYCIITNLLI